MYSVLKTVCCAQYGVCYQSYRHQAGLSAALRESRWGFSALSVLRVGATVVSFCLQGFPQHSQREKRLPLVSVGCDSPATSRERNQEDAQWLHLHLH